MTARRLARLAFAALLFCGPAAPGAQGEEPASLEDLFRWGEYDSLIHALEPSRSGRRGDSALGALASRDDSLAEARARMYLGVAYWVKGRPEDGVEEFKVATRLDRGLRLEPLYSTPEMAARFEQLVEAGRAEPLPAAPEPAGSPSPGPQEPAGKGTRRLAWPRLVGAAVVGAAVVGAAAAAGVYYLAQPRKPTHETITVVNPE